MKSGMKIVSSREHAFIWLQGNIVRGTAEQFRRHFKRVGGHDNFDNPLTIYITGPGGYKDEMHEMFAYIECARRHIITVAHGNVLSAALLLFQAGKTRCAVKGTALVFHRTKLVINTNEVDWEMAEHFTKEIRRMDAESLAILARRGRPMAEIGELLEDEATINIAEALKLQLIDSYYSRPKFLKHRRMARTLLRSPA